MSISTFSPNVLWGGWGVSTHRNHVVGKDLRQLELVAMVLVLVDVVEGEPHGVGLLLVPATAGHRLQGSGATQRHRHAQQQH